jgi:predicted O-methyltransferase YrrM
VASNRPLSANRSLWRRVRLENLLYAYRLVVSQPLALSLTLSRREARGLLDRARLERRIPEVIALPWLASAWEDELREPYYDYTRNVSDEMMAISLRLATAMLVLCDLSKPARLLDTGSGFSSYALRLWATRNGGEVTSVDHDLDWLRRTKEYLEASSLPVSNLLTWDAFAKDVHDPFDFILHDIGGGARPARLAPVLGHASTSSLVVLDDMHKPGYERHARRVLSDRGFEIYSLRAHTLDMFDRFAWVAIRTRGSRETSIGGSRGHEPRVHPATAAGGLTTDSTTSLPIRHDERRERRVHLQGSEDPRGGLGGPPSRVRDL